MDRKVSAFSNNKMARENAKLVQNMAPNVAITLGNPRCTRVEDFHKDAKFLFDMITRKTIGSAWRKLPKERWIQAIGVVEHTEGNPHMHLAVVANDAYKSTLAARASYLWTTKLNKGHFYMDSIHNLEAYSHYMMKGFRSEHTPLFIYPVWAY